VDGSRSVDVSVIIVNYNVKHFAEQCLRSVQAAGEGLLIEIFLVDNDSADGSVDYLRPKFPGVTFICNEKNLGFGRANNLALEQARGRYLLILNPDSLVAQDTLRNLVAYLDSHPKVGAAGPKILNRYGQYDNSSKRGFPTPWVSFSYLSGLHRLFPRSRLFGSYHMLYLEENEPAEIDALTGACMMVRREAYETCGGFDEAFFMYGEDIDWCYRMKLAGWQIHYAPITSIIHFRGESTRRSDFDRDRAFYGAMHLFLNKHFRGRYPFWAHKFLDFGVVLTELATRLARLWKRTAWSVIDLLAICLVMLLGRWLRFQRIDLPPAVIGSYVLQSVITIACIVGIGGYGKRRGQTGALALGMLMAFFVNSSFTYFFKQFAFSRFTNLFTLAVGGAALWGWRQALNAFQQSASYRRFYKRRALLVGIGEVAKEAIQHLNNFPLAPYQLIGAIDPEDAMVGRMLQGVPVIGGREDLERLVKQEEIEEVLFAYDQPNYNLILQQMSEVGRRKEVSFKIISSNDSNEGNVHPFLSVEYTFPRGLAGSLRRISTLVLKR
jgi:O-antigen biosynthesis protein